MRPWAFSSLLAVSLTFGVSGETRSELLSQISLKEKQLAEIQKELIVLRNKLAIPDAPGSSYTVKTGDTIHSIAKEFKVAAEALKKQNKVTDPTKLAIGRILVIPATTAPERIASTPSSPKKAGDYVVSKGDTFYSIARRHRMPLDQLKALNPNVSTHLISPGQIITVSALSAPEPPVMPRTPAPAPTPEPKPEVQPPAPPNPELSEKKTKVEEDPIPLPPSPAILKENDPVPPPTVPSVILTEEMTFEEFAEKHDTTTESLNELNGWSLPKATILARGSEIQLPQ